MHKVSAPVLWTSNHGSKIVQVFIQKISSIQRPAQLKPVLVNDQLYGHPQICKTVFPRQESMKYYLSSVLQLSETIWGQFHSLLRIFTSLKGHRKPAKNYTSNY